MSREEEFLGQLALSARNSHSWRERLQWVRDRLTDPAFTGEVLPQLAAVAIYLRFLATGELRCEEDGRHFRPNHHAEAAQQIETALERLSTLKTSWVLRRIYPYLPSWGEEFRRSEPLTRIRDIAHRNDIPQDLKREIKQRLQNKLHRCAGPEDLRTSEEILRRITASGADYSKAFVQEFRVFHDELREFFNATALEARLRALGKSSDIDAFLEKKSIQRPSQEQRVELLERLTALRRQLAEQLGSADPRRRSQLRLADIGLEDYAFTLLSECANRFGVLAHPGDWPAFLRALTAALDNLRLSQVEPEECAALRSECGAWAGDVRPEDRFHMLRVRATLARARRLAESYTDRITRLFTPLVERLGRELGVAEHAVKVFTEGDVRGHVVFQLSRLVDRGMEATGLALRMQPWEAVVVGEASGRVVRAGELSEVEAEAGPLLLLLKHADGDAEVPSGVKGILLGHPMPHLSHFGVRARQARVPFVTYPGPGHLDHFAHFVGKWARLRVTPDGVVVQEAAADEHGKVVNPPDTGVSVPDVVLSDGPAVLALEKATPQTCGAKAAAAWRLLELAGRSGGLFRAPRGLAVPFGVMERCLAEAPEVRREYEALVGQLAGIPLDKLESLLDRLRRLVSDLPVPGEVSEAVNGLFGTDTRLAVRSSSNGEDLEQLAGAGLYESVVNVATSAVAPAVARVWASLWTRRATLSRAQAGIAHDRIRMAVLVQELVVPDVSFIMHTANPQTGGRDEAVAELAVGLGEVLASSSTPGTPYRLVCRRKSDEVGLLACASFGIALRPSSQDGEVSPERLDYSRVPLSTDPGVAQRLGRRLAQIATFLEGELGSPQDMEGVCVGEDVYLVQTRPQQGL